MLTIRTLRLFNCVVCIYIQGDSKRFTKNETSSRSQLVYQLFQRNGISKLTFRGTFTPSKSSTLIGWWMRRMRRRGNSVQKRRRQRVLMSVNTQSAHLFEISLMLQSIEMCKNNAKWRGAESIQHEWDIKERCRLCVHGHCASCFCIVFTHLYALQHKWDFKEMCRRCVNGH